MFSAEYFDASLSIDFLHAMLLFFFLGFGLRFVAPDAGDVLWVVDIP